MRRAGLLIIVLLCSCVSFALDRDVKTIATALEKQYGVKFHKLPLIARIVMKPALWGSGVRLDMVTFEGLQPETTKLEDIEAAMKGALGSDWSWFIRTTSKKTNERDVIFVRGAGERFDMMIVSIQPDEAAVLKVRLKPDEMKKWMADPDDMALHRETYKQKEQEQRKEKHKEKEEPNDLVLAHSDSSGKQNQSRPQ